MWPSCRTTRVKLKQCPTKTESGRPVAHVLVIIKNTNLRPQSLSRTDCYLHLIYSTWLRNVAATILRGNRSPLSATLVCQRRGQLLCRARPKWKGCAPHFSKMITAGERSSHYSRGTRRGILLRCRRAARALAQGPYLIQTTQQATCCPTGSLRGSYIAECSSDVADDKIPEISARLIDRLGLE
jgi:hypothetical protein